MLLVYGIDPCERLRENFSTSSADGFSFVLRDDDSGYILLAAATPHALIITSEPVRLDRITLSDGSVVSSSNCSVFGEFPNETS